VLHVGTLRLHGRRTQVIPGPACATHNHQPPPEWEQHCPPVTAHGTQSLLPRFPFPLLPFRGPYLLLALGRFFFLPAATLAAMATWVDGAARVMLLLLLLLPWHTAAFELCGGACSSHMVLQRAPVRARLWGVAGSVPGNSVIAVELDTHAVAQTTAQENGTWEVFLPAQPAGTGHSITVTSSEHGRMTVTLVDVAFGDVYLCCKSGNDVRPGSLLTC